MSNKPNANAKSASRKEQSRAPAREAKPAAKASQKVAAAKTAVRAAAKKVVKAAQDAWDGVERRKAAKAAKAAQAKSLPPRAVAAKVTWARPEVAAARSKRHPVVVAGTVYRSVAAAFKALGLPLEKHIRFRKELVAKGRAKFDGFMFKVAKTS